MRAEVGQRRASYGPGSPQVGSRGAQTLEGILDASLEVFADKGYHDTTIQDIVAKLGISRAALYQYFESKEKIFVELLEVCGAAVVDVIRQLGELGPDAAGFANLRWWLAEWSRVYDRYATMFIEWANIDAPGAPVGSLVSQFNTHFNRRVAQRLIEGGISGVDAHDTAIVLTGVILRWNYVRHSNRNNQRDVAEQDYYFAVLVQLMLFPETPGEATRGGRDVLRRWSQHRVGGRLVTRNSGALPAPYRNRTEGLTARSAGTIRALVTSAARSFASRGYQRTSIDEVVSAAGFARGTFYKYFDAKLELLVALADICAQESIAGSRRLEYMSREDFGSEFVDWCGSTLTMSQEFRSVYRAWLERSPHSPELLELRRGVVDAIERALFIQLSGVDRGHALELHSCLVFLIALFDQMPDSFELNRQSHSHDYMARFLAVLLDRAIFGRDLVVDLTDASHALVARGAIGTA
ncbi:TetR/AcrR family transcriptional regulator [Microbacterium aurantiacum]|uniref:TetR/AcrR family transcriptional regulator n=1 Tax=Microbacterium aurantiacum TaxID=162393 RepID=A0ABT8FW31_9MICO|nr:TetR/AcrR family transcriptional regulator [Microbacterium aurantiacum]MDN4465396.1 TetR/AcrR family transcriptional regulator [Microbacterium aurantiacum]